MSLTLNKASLELMSTFEAVTRTKVVDCFEIDGLFYFIVPETMLGKAIGKGAKHVHLLKNKLKKPVKIIELKSDVKRFIADLVNPATCEITVEDKVVVLKAPDRKTKALLIGRNAKNKENLLSIVQRHFRVDEIIIE